MSDLAPLGSHYVDHFAVRHPLAEHFAFQSFDDVVGHFGVGGQTALGLTLYGGHRPA